MAARVVDWAAQWGGRPSVDDIDGLYSEFVPRGVPIRIPPQTKPWGMREFALHTPDGHRMTFASATRWSC